MAKRRIYVLATGGTIAGSQKDQSEPGYSAGALSISDLLAAVPKITDLADLNGEQIGNIGSQDMNDSIWLKLANKISGIAQRSDVDGIVVTHGTDTLEETSYFISLVAKTDKPIVFTASMRPATAISADGPMNLYQAVSVACSEQARGRGALVVINSEIHYAAEVTKTHTINPSAMKSPNRGRAGECDAGVLSFFPATEKLHTLRSPFSLPASLTALPHVDIIYSHAGATGDLVDYAAQSGARAIVIAGVGDGNMTSPLLEAAKRAADKGVIIVRSSHVGSGSVKRNIEVDDDKLGFISSYELSPQKSRILAALGLLQAKSLGISEDFALRAYLQDLFTVC